MIHVAASSKSCLYDTKTFLPPSFAATVAAIEFTPQFVRDWLQVHEVAESASGAFPVDTRFISFIFFHITIFVKGHKHVNFCRIKFTFSTFSLTVQKQ